ncbi:MULTISPECIES: cell wall metabolism sensor histidine kinase WalK [unclassified Rhodococcus (in: high G+C Gram-positive bacteria)]|uniref:sensor histidine kinase n=1 Tax=unclassified Rhodococcus (in: high G+C Gram-positive bacteria) TaxID=192944 RepID=UPI000B9C4024|nr:MULTISPECIES: ATP-binding protein [unclassified Rhodococcus (in: high G+C Gram-positive bacteria)]OZE33046.1 two-component sensor histidine kinase [Rhodococcus sp. 05-2254-4]OZE44058.1 two-component sensor histidine kinase [Rhodococcus sp. 05-2254-3]OZE56259.1 two-component sensor histidine kinase [Rhodococcus sp. 05-2254-2]OZF46830.1 two-component sensor histidine kinase [Rhodococcus sp. 14-1411-2a]
MSVASAVLLAIAAAFVGYLVGGVLIPYLNTRHSERRRATSGLTMSQVLDLIVLASESGIAVVDQFHDVVLFNPRAEELGLVRNRLIDDRAWDAVLKVLADGNPVEVDLSSKNPRTGRDKIAVRCVARLLSKEDKRFVVLFADDDSEQVRMEATRRDFVANVSHELKTPVGAMSLLAEALLESADDPDSVRHFGGKVVAESKRLGNMVTELIALSRLQGAEKLPDLEVVDVDTVVNEAMDRSKLAAENAGISVTTDHPSGLEVLGDQALLVTALANLIQNAIAYSSDGAPVSVSRALRGDNVAFAVTDRGIGIAKEDQERVFERFFRVDKARSRATGGTGLGLAIAKHVAANHNGSISLWSKLGTGSTFTLQIPAYFEEEDDASVTERENQ